MYVPSCYIAHITGFSARREGWGEGEREREQSSNTLRDADMPKLAVKLKMESITLELPSKSSKLVSYDINTYSLT